jgi:signal transduction histidine kinase
MKRLRDLPIRRKLTLVILLTTGSALLLACAAFIVHDLLVHKRDEPVAHYLLVGVVVWLGSLLVALLFAARLQRVVSGPIVELAETARVVTEQKDYSIRARRQAGDETGLVTDAFNQMLTQLQTRDNEPNFANQLLEKRVTERTDELRRQLDEHQRTEEALRESQQQLRHSQKMEAVGRLAGGVAHDFNNLLTVINGYTELLAKQIDGHGSGRRLVDEIQRASGRAAALTRQLLAFGRKQVLQAKPLDLNSVVAGLEKMLRRVLGENVELRIKSDPGLAHVLADPGQIEQVILNLVINARDAMPEGGRLTVRTANVEIDEADVRRGRGARPGPHVRLAVSDTGVGISPDLQARIFEPFFTTKEPGEGTGLGLSTVDGIVRQHEGSIEVESAPGRGSTFAIHLMRCDEDPEPVEPRPADDTPSRGTETVLVLEDEDAVREMVCEIVRERGYRVLVARHPDDAIRIAERHEGPIDLLLTDVVMPGMSGRAVAQRLQPLRPEMRVLYISGYPDARLGHQHVLDPGEPLLQKPFTPRALALRMREILDS